MSQLQQKVFERVLNMAQIFQIGVLQRGPNMLWTCRWNESGVESSVSYQLVQNPGDKSVKLRLRYKVLPDVTGNGQSMDYTTSLATSISYKRKTWYWFVCPLVINGRPCKRKVRNLYFLPSSAYFGCKHCRDLQMRALPPSAQRLIRQTEMITESPKGERQGGNGSSTTPDLHLGWRPTPSRLICAGCGCLSEGEFCCNCAEKLGVRLQHNFFEIIGVNIDVSDEDLAMAFRRKIKEYHPDRVAHLGEKLRQVAEREIKLVNQAYSILKNQETREVHLRDIESANGS